MKERILIFSDFYQPSFTGGGAPEMVLNIVNRFFDRYDFFVVTRNHDNRRDQKPFTTVQTDAWNSTGNARVFYSSKKNLNRSFFAKLIIEVAPDLILLNSPFSTPTIIFLLLRRKKRFRDIPVILAACGSLSKGSLSLKRVKKWVFLRCAGLVGLYKSVIWKASFIEEMNEIKTVIGSKATVMVAPDLTPAVIDIGLASNGRPAKHEGSVKFVYFSRIERKKNLHYFLDRLKEVKDGEISLEIIGPPEDMVYWRECIGVMASLPRNVSVTVSGAFPRPEALQRVAQNHFFVLPTLNENFGYVFIESLAAGCPNLTSDNTVWNDLEERNAGWRIPLDNVDEWTEKIKYCIAMDEEAYSSMSAAARNFAADWLSRSNTEEATEELLRAGLSPGIKKLEVK
jgi:glycosyltransferase involved in cell wall biosynthesis